MCGIVGIYNFNQSPVDQRELKKFRYSLAHRGSDAEGIYINKSQNLGFGHTRLRIIDLNLLLSPAASIIKQLFMIKLYN